MDLLYTILCLPVLSCRYRPRSPEGKDKSSSLNGTTGTVLAGAGASTGVGNNNSSNDDLQQQTSPDGHGAPGTKSPTAPVNDSQSANDSSKWPFKPGVHLHINGLHSLGKSVSTAAKGFSYGTKHSTNQLTGAAKGLGGNVIINTCTVESSMLNGKAAGREITEQFYLLPSSFGPLLIFVHRSKQQHRSSDLPIQIHVVSVFIF